MPRPDKLPDLVFTSLCCRRLRAIEATLVRRSRRYEWIETLEYQCAPGRGCKGGL